METIAELNIEKNGSNIEEVDLLSDKGKYSYAFDLKLRNNVRLVLKLFRYSYTQCVKEYFLQRCFDFSPVPYQIINVKDINNVINLCTETNYSSTLFGFSMERYDCTLFDFKYFEENCEFIITELLTQLCFLHHFGVYHCDIKLENIFINHEEGKVTKITLADFGLSENYSSKISYDRIPPAISPDCLFKNSYDYFKEEIFLLGLFLINLFTRRNWYSKKDTNIFNLCNKCIKEEGLLITYTLNADDKSSKEPEGVTEEYLKEFILKSINKEKLNSDIIDRITKIISLCIRATPESRADMKKLYQIWTGKELDFTKTSYKDIYKKVIDNVDMEISVIKKLKTIKGIDYKKLQHLNLAIIAAYLLDKYSLPDVKFYVLYEFLDCTYNFNYLLQNQKVSSSQFIDNSFRHGFIKDIIKNDKYIYLYKLKDYNYKFFSDNKSLLELINN